MANRAPPGLRHSPGISVCRLGIEQKGRGGFLKDTKQRSTVEPPPLGKSVRGRVLKAKWF